MMLSRVKVTRAKRRKCRGAGKAVQLPTASCLIGRLVLPLSREGHVGVAMATKMEGGPTFLLSVEDTDPGRASKEQDENQAGGRAIRGRTSRRDILKRDGHFRQDDDQICAVRDQRIVQQATANGVDGHRERVPSTHGLADRPSSAVVQLEQNLSSDCRGRDHGFIL